MSSPDVIVIGAGVLGLCTAAELGARGHAVTVVDPGGPNASSVAAGMLAPAMESLLDGLSRDHAARLTRARDLWPAFAARQGLDLHRDGAEWRGPDPDADLARLGALGFTAERRDGGLFTPDDWRIDATQALARLADAPGVTSVAASADRVTRQADGWRVLTSHGQTLSARHLILATGAAPALEGLPASIAALIATIQPIRGQLTPIACQPPGHVIRAPGLYAAPSARGALSGATMQPGDRSLLPDTEVARRQFEGALALLACDGVAGPPRVGIRGASPDGLPMAGSSGLDGLHLALAPRRNGWLLGPMVARIVADGIEGRTSSADAAALDPLRFAGSVGGRHEPHVDADP